MTLATAEARTWFAEDLRVCGRLRSGALVEAFATVPRERFVGPGPWLVRGLLDPAAYRTDGADPSLVYHNVSIAIDPARELYNGQPGLIARWLEDLALRPGARVWHIGAGTGYFTAIIAHVVGPSGTVLADEIDPALAAAAMRNLTDQPWVTVRTSDGTQPPTAPVDVVLVHAGATHILDVWLDALADGGRLLVPLTASLTGVPTISKGLTVQVTRTGREYAARACSLVAIYSLVGLRDDGKGTVLGQALTTGRLARVTHLRRDTHAPDDPCVLHGDTVCLSI
jgi:protein-L-isoaspartate(D-aspartate) O-methyltransferase